MKSMPPMLAVALIAVPTHAIAGETVTYSYDANGRLVKSVRSGTANNGVEVDYTHDKADNRTEYKVAGGRSKVVVVPLNGLTVIPIPEP